MGNVNVMVNTDEDNHADIGGCKATGSEDIRNDDKKMQQCKDECSANTDCVAVTFHSKGSMLKKLVDGMTMKEMEKSRDGFQTYVKPSASSCRRNGLVSMEWTDKICQRHCGAALDQYFDGNEDATGELGIACCWNDCANQTWNGPAGRPHSYLCYCDAEDALESDVSTSLLV